MRHFRIAAVGVLFALLAVPAWCETLRYSSAEGSSVRVSGTSTLHDWTAKGGQIDGTIEFEVEGVKPGDPPEAIARAIVANPKVKANASVPATTLKSGKKDMDVKMHSALNSKTYPSLTYTLTEVGKVKQMNARTFVIDTKGDLTVAGTTRTLSTPMTIEIRSAKELYVSCEFPTRMTDFNVKPPVALGGMVKSGNNVTVKVTWSVAG